MLLKDGTILRSKLEIQFFNKLLYYGLTIDDANMNYSNSNYKYDFKVNGKIIEIAGILNNPVYKNIILYKQQTFKPFILTSATEFDDFIENVLIKNDEEKIKYYIERPL